MAVPSVRVAELRRVAPRRSLALLTLFAVVAVISTAPAIADFGSSFIAEGGLGYGEPTAGDHLQTVYHFWLFGQQLEHGAAPWLDPYSFQPLTPLQVNLSAWPWGLPFWPLNAAFGLVIAWNVLLLATIVLAGIATYAWLRELDLPVEAALVGGIAFAVAPYRLAQSDGHLLGWAAALIPLVLWAFERSRRATSRVRAHVFGLLAAIALISIPASGQVHLALGAIPFTFAYALIRWRRIPTAWIAAATGAAIGLGYAIKHVSIDTSNASTGRSLDQVKMFQASFSDLVSRFASHDIVKAEHFVYVGWLTPVLAVAGGVLLARRARLLGALLLTAAVIPLVFALGTNTPIYAPIWRHLPPLHFTRVPGRLIPIADLALAALVAVAVAWLLTKVPSSRRRIAAVAAVILVAADLIVLPFRASAADPNNAAYRALAASPPGRVVELPLFEPGIHYGSIYQYYELQAPRQRPGGYSTLAPYPAYHFFWDENRINCGILRPGDIQFLQSLGITTLMFHVAAYKQSARGNAWFAWRALQQAGLRATAHGGPVWLFPLTTGRGPAQPPPVKEPNHVAPVLCEGWRGFQMRERDAPIWLYTGHTVTLDLTAPGNTTATLWVDNRPPSYFVVDHKLTLKIPLSGLRWHSIVLEVPQLFLDANPPQGLTIKRLTFRGN